MKYKSNFKLIFSFFMIFLFSFNLVNSSEEYNGKYILNSNSKQYDKLQEALEDALDTDTVKVNGKIQ